MADAIYSLCTYPALFEYLKEEGKKEVDGITWEKSRLENSRSIRGVLKTMVNNKTINKNENYLSLFFEIHQIIHLKRYRFFDIGNDHYYYDDYANETGMNEVAERSYLPALNID